MTKEIYLVVTIDTECDKDSHWCLQKPHKFTSVTQGIPAVLMPLFRKYDIIPTFLLSPEILGDDACVSLLAAINGCELGTHLHGEFIEPQSDWNADRASTPQLLYHRDIERQKLINLTSLFIERFGYAPTSFRAGRFGLSDHSLDILEELNYKVDSSVTPFWTHYFEGRATRNYWGAPWHPYHPSSQDPRQPGSLRLLQVPVTIMNQTLAKWPKIVLRQMENKTNLHRRILGRFSRPVAKTVWLRPQRSTAEEMIDLAEFVINRSVSDKPVVLNLMYHTVEIIPGASPYAQTEADVQLIIQSQNELFGYLTQKYALKSAGLSEIFDVYAPCSS